MAYKRISPQPVIEGGTGAQTFTANGLLVGNGSSPIGALAAGSTGTVLAGINAANPAFSATPTLTSLTIAALPTVNSEAANKQYVDLIAAGLNFQSACVAASTANLTATYANGAAGVGATLTNAGAFAVFSIDGQSPTVTQRVLIKNQTSQLENGIYTVTTVGDGVSINWVLTRATDFDTPAEIQPGDLVAVNLGTQNANTLWLQVNTITTIGVDSIVFNQFLGGGATTFPADSGTANVNVNTLNVFGGSNIATSGAGSTLTVALVNSPSVSGSVTAATGLTATTGGITATGTSNINISGASNTNIGTGSNSGTVTVGNTSSGVISIACGTAGLALGTTANAHTTTMGSTTGASSTIIQSGSGALNLTSTNGSMTIASGTGALALSNDAAATTVTVATGAGAKTLTLGSTNTTSTTNIQAGSGGIKIPAFTEGSLITSSTGVISTVTGTAGFVLTANTAGTAPSFQILPSQSVLAYTPVSSSPYVVLTADQFIAVDSTGGARTVQLPNTPTTGKSFIIKDAAGTAQTNNITVTTVGGIVLIDGATTMVMNTQFSSINVVFSGTEYNVY